MLIDLIFYSKFKITFVDKKKINDSLFLLGTKDMLI